MDRQLRINRWFLAVIACVALTADASLAAGRHGHGSKSAPQTSKAVPHEETAGDHPAKSETGEDPVRNPTRESDKSGKPEHIDLVRHDDGYINLRRRATRSSLIAAKKKLPIIAPVAVAPHLPLPAGATVEPVRNSAGVTATAVKKPDPIAAVPEVTAKPGLAKNNLGLSVNEIRRPEVHVTATGAVAPVTGINGTTMGHAGVGGIGGPAKDRSAIGGSTYRRF
jgi:hypothetical protein